MSAYSQYFIIMGIFVFGGRIMDFVQENVWKYETYRKVSRIGTDEMLLLCLFRQLLS